MVKGKGRKCFDFHEIKLVEKKECCHGFGPSKAVQERTAGSVEKCLGKEVNSARSYKPLYTEH